MNYQLFFFFIDSGIVIFWDIVSWFLILGSRINEHSDGAKHGINFYSSITRSAPSETGRLCKDTGQPWAFYLMGQGVGTKGFEIDGVKEMGLGLGFGGIRGNVCFSLFPFFQFLSRIGEGSPSKSGSRILERKKRYPNPANDIFW